MHSCVSQPTQAAWRQGGRGEEGEDIDYLQRMLQHPEQACATQHVYRTSRAEKSIKEQQL